MKVLDTFAGAGGFSLGFDLSGHFDIIRRLATIFKLSHEAVNRKSMRFL
jgi:site-specific DNA-cytosine methylase